jgi:hypothetical protein
MTLIEYVITLDSLQIEDAKRHKCKKSVIGVEEYLASVAHQSCKKSAPTFICPLSRRTT